MTKSAPIIAEWDGESLVPVRQFEKYCDVNFIVGERYRVTLQEERSANSHNHYFAVLTELWHIIPRALIGKSADTDDNMQPAHVLCHAVKTKADVHAINKAKRREARHMGFKKSKSPLPFGRDSKWKKRMDGQVIDRKTGQPAGRI